MRLAGRGLWSIALAVALYWPSRTLSMLDGLPLNSVSDAIVLGVLVPFLWVMYPQFLDARRVRLGVLMLLGMKLAGSFLLTQEGLCARLSTAAPFRTEVLTIPIEEPRGVLRSWDVRADWRADVPTCTAIIDRPYEALSAFPVWFLNITDFDVRPDGPPHGEAARRNLAMDISGAISVAERGRFAIDLDRDMRLAGTIGSQSVAASGAAPVAVDLDPGVHTVAVHVALTGDRWKFAPIWNGRSAFSTATVTVVRMRAIDAWLAPVLRYGTLGLVLLLVTAWTVTLLAQYRGSPMAVAWTVAASAVLITIGLGGPFQRFAGLALVVGPLVPIAAGHRRWRGALLLVGVPWLAFFVARSIPQIGHISAYSVDDWLAYQVAGYRIFMSGFWLEGGSRVFDYQPLYRWIGGALHLVFGDSSVGEVYWDAACLLAGAFVAFRMVEPIAGFRCAVGAAAVTLATFTLGTIWYFVGRGLSEIAAAGFGFFSALSLLTAGGRGRAVAVGAAILATLMFYTRLNHLIFALTLVALILPRDAPAAWRRLSQAIRPVDWRPAFAYLATFAAGLVLFAVRTWWYTGHLSVFYGTSLKNNDTGLRLATLGSLDVWRRIAHSLSALVWMNEPPHADPRAIVVAVGAVVSVLALLQLPGFRRLPVSIAAVTAGAGASSLFAHTHNYPGRMSIHLVPFAVAMAVVAAAFAFGWRDAPAAPPAATALPV